MGMTVTQKTGNFFVKQKSGEFTVTQRTGMFYIKEVANSVSDIVALFDFGNAIHSDGSNDVITGIVNSVLGGGNAFVCEFWFKNDTATFATNATLFGSFNNGATLGWGVTGISGGRLMRFQIFSGSNVYGSYTPASITSKTHVRIVFDGLQSTNETRLRVWFNGAEVTLSYTGTIPATVGSSGTPIRFCRFTTAANFYDGWLDEFCLWDNTTGSDTYNGGAGAVPSATGLIRHLKFNESNPVGTLADETGNDTFTGTNFNNDANSGLGVLT